MKTKSFIYIGFLVILFFNSCTPPMERAEEFYEKGKSFMYQSNPKLAIIEYQKGLEYVPDHARLLYESGNCYMNFRDYKTAIDFFNKAIDSDPKYADAYFNRGQSWFYLNELDLCCADYRKAHALGRPNLADLLKMCK